MKKIVIYLAWVLCIFNQVMAQQVSNHSVRYLVTFDKTNQLFTAWVVPEYDTPNAFNDSDSEKGATAQLTLELPNTTSLSEIQDVAGIWEKKPYRFEQNEVLRNAGIDLKDKVYYVIGKAPRETTYGTFKKGIPVALFTFKLDGSMDESQIKVVTTEDEFVHVADTKLSLNVASSFYSRSGQKFGSNAIPLEQFNGQIRQKELFASNSDGNENSELPGVFLYPNPFQSDVKVQFFYPNETTSAILSVSDVRGRQVFSKEIALVKGYNEQLLGLRHLPDGSYVLKVNSGDWGFSSALVKNK